MFSKILVAVDGSDQSRKAVRYASDLAVKYGSALHIVHAPQIEVETLSLGAGTLGAMPTRTSLSEQGEAILRNASALAAEAGCKPTASEVLMGDTTKSILRYAEQNGIDLIVSGSRGLGGLRGLVQGSVSQKLTSHAACPVLTIR